jgi:hypothetical protein
MPVDALVRDVQRLAAAVEQGPQRRRGDVTVGARVRRVVGQLAHARSSSSDHRGNRVVNKRYAIGNYLFGQGIVERDRCLETLELFAEKVISRFR